MAVSTHVREDFNNNNRDDNLNLAVVGAGLWRTGTTSLMEALQILYGEPCYHMRNVVLIHKKEHIDKWVEVYESTRNTKANTASAEKAQLRRKVLMKEVLKGYKCCVESPGNLVFDELLNWSPNAKVILTVRDNSSIWLESSRETVSPKDLFTRWTPWSHHLMEKCSRRSGFLHLAHMIMEKFTGSPEVYADDEKFATCYEEWNDNVKQKFTSDRLLVFNAKEGWAPLCKFLGKPVPNVPFPHLNKRDFLKHYFAVEFYMKWAIFYIVPIIIGILAVLLHKSLY